ncbi:hypothetical protein DFP74_4471 [Nocardiopsis sp. Huas11]|uniref:hypothetical protein n=1 Tax=Nocardiopsis sp. Huas11 TaxID=2183912 RepID=UPI000EB212EC|nr:hypothetical protein [Nocardiopsis sp. Huas11]RKS08749.1 hypothetical protein DFP74_4471 [Nocardiopsis sp. Huas11]
MADDHRDAAPDHPATGLLARLRGSAPADEVLSRHDCHLDRAEYADAVPLELVSGEPLVGLATTSAGESFQLCGGDERRPVLYYDDADSVLVLGRDLAEAVELLIGVPYLLDIMHTLAGRGPAAATAEHEELAAQGIAADEARSRERTHHRLAAELGLRAMPVADLLHRLHGTAEELAPGLEVLWVDGGESNPIPHAVAPQA